MFHYKEDMNQNHFGAKQHESKLQLSPKFLIIVCIDQKALYTNVISIYYFLQSTKVKTKRGEIVVIIIVCVFLMI